ncbi:MAG: hypothetical protein WB626_01515 [Bacteroidota bacterium]
MKRLATVLLTLIVVGSMAFAEAKPGGIARQIAMGGSQGGTNLITNPFITEDPALVLVNPAYLSQYGDYIWMNVAGGALNNMSVTPGTPDNGYGHQFSGVGIKVSRELTVGAVLSYDPSFVNLVPRLLSGYTPPFPNPFGLPTLPPFITARAAQAIPQVQNVWEVLGSYDAGSAEFGLGVMYGAASTETKTSATGGGSTEDEASASVIGFRLGANVDLGSGSSFSAAGALRMDKATDDRKTNAGTLGEYSASGTEIQFSARGKFPVSNAFHFVPYALFGSVSAEPKEDAFPTGGAATTFSEKLSVTVIAVGLGGEYRTADFFLAGGLSMQYGKGKIETTNAGVSGTGELSYMALPVVNVGGEWWFTEWLGGRAGYYRALASTKNKTESAAGSTETTTSFPHSFLMMGALDNRNYDGLVTLGLGMRFGGFALDATVSEEALRRGLGLMGSQDNINTFGYITTSYNFE